MQPNRCSVRQASRAQSVPFVFGESADTVRTFPVHESLKADQPMRLHPEPIHKAA